MKTALQLLQEAKAKIATPETWTQYTAARDALGGSTASTGPAAVCWCALGALDAVSGTCRNRGQATAALRSASMRLYGRFVSEVNDILGFTAVHAVFDDAIEQVADDSP